MEDKYILIMEYAENYVTINDFIQENKACLNEKTAKDIMWQTLSAVNHCMKKCVYHNDLNGNNILIHPDTKDVKLIDFGQALLSKETGDLTFWTHFTDD